MVHKANNIVCSLTVCPIGESERGSEERVYLSDMKKREETGEIDTC